VSNELNSIVRKFITDNFLFREDLESFPDDASFLEAGIIDSTGVLELISFLEGSFDIEVLDEEMVPENFDSVSRIVGYVQRKLDARRDEQGLGIPVGPLPSYAG
jgi:acyl carrier protein